jgi:WD40 repeat protein
LDGTVRIWSGQSGKELRSLRANAERIGFSPDGKRLATAGAVNRRPDRPELKIWDVETGRELCKVPGHQLFVTNVAFSPDGRHLASASGNPIKVPYQPGEVLISDAQSGEKVFSFRPDIGMVYGLAYSPDGHYLALSGTEKRVQIWDTVTRREVWTLVGHQGAVTAVVFSPDGGTLASGDDGGRVILWDVGTGQQLRTIRAHVGAIYGLSYGKDRHRLATASLDVMDNEQGGVKLWDTRSGRQVLALPGQLTVAFSADGRRLAALEGGSIHTAREVRVWEVTDRESQRVRTGAVLP